MILNTLFLLFLLRFSSCSVTSTKCLPQRFGYDSVACVCTERYCDTFEPVFPKNNQYLLVTSNKEGLRFESIYRNIDKRNSVDQTCERIIRNLTVSLKLNVKERGQTILGFGGAFTDAVGYNLNKVSTKLREMVIGSFYERSKGLAYNMGRTTIGHTDFSLGPYYNNDKDYDVKMTHWKLTYQDLNYKLPYIKLARSMVEDKFLLMCATWSTPEWMRDTGDRYKEKFRVKPEYYDALALYLVKFLEAFEKQGIEMYAISVANEPLLNLGSRVYEGSGNIYTAWTFYEYSRFITNHFGPALNQFSNKIKLILIDDLRAMLTRDSLTFLTESTDVMKFTDLIGIHSYANNYIRPSVLDNLKNAFPNVSIINNEFCSGQGEGVKLGEWSRAEQIAGFLFEEINYHIAAWVHWNLVLDTDGEPHFVGIPVDAPIIIDAEKNTFYKQPSYYVMGHFSKFMTRGSVKIGLSASLPNVLQYAAVLRPDGYVVIVVYNPTENEVDTSIAVENGRFINAAISAFSVNTIVYQP